MGAFCCDKPSTVSVHSGFFRKKKRKTELFIVWEAAAATTQAPCLCHTCWFKGITPNSFRVQRPRRFSEIDPEILHTCLMCPCRTFSEWGFLFLFFSARYLGFWVFGIFGSKGIPHFQREKNNIRKRLGSGTLNTCAQFQGISLKNSVDIWTLVRESAKIAA